MSLKLQCSDFLEFQDALKKMRDMDDKIIYALNVSIPTDSFKGQVNASSTCKDLHNKLTTGNKCRENAIKQCILVSADRLRDLKEKREANNDDIAISKHFKAEQRKLRLLQSELSVEEVVKERTNKVFNERCRLFYKPDIAS